MKDLLKEGTTLVDGSSNPPDVLLPPRGVEVWIDHPAFSQCELLSDAIICFRGDVALARKSGQGSTEIDLIDSWLKNDAPIPEKMVRTLLRMRKQIAKIKGLPKPSPIREK